MRKFVAIPIITPNLFNKLIKRMEIKEDSVLESITDSRTPTYLLFFYEQHIALHMSKVYVAAQGC